MEIDNVSPDRYYNYSDKGQVDRGGSFPGAPAADTGLWVKLPPSVTLPPGSGGSGYPIFQAGLTLTARTSDGREMPLRWRTTGYQNSNGPTYILASIPAGYPDTVRWADVTLEDHHGDSATWRILHLPPMQHVLVPRSRRRRLSTGETSRSRPAPIAAPTRTATATARWSCAT